MYNQKPVPVSFLQVTPTSFVVGAGSAFSRLRRSIGWGNNLHLKCNAEERDPVAAAPCTAGIARTCEPLENLFNLVCWG